MAQVLAAQEKSVTIDGQLIITIVVKRRTTFEKL